MNISENNPCRDCSDRHLGCHANCIKYNEWKNRLNKYNDHVREVNHLEHTAYVSNRRKRNRS